MGATYYEIYGGYHAICAGRGDSNMQEAFLNNCPTFALMCSPYATGLNFSYDMSCVFNGIKQYKTHICNGGFYVIGATTGDWSYRGYSGSIASVSDGRDGACFAMCILGELGNKYDGVYDT